MKNPKSEVGFKVRSILVRSLKLERAGRVVPWWPDG